MLMRLQTHCIHFGVTILIHDRHAHVDSLQIGQTCFFYFFCPFLMVLAGRAGPGPRKDHPNRTIAPAKSHVQLHVHAPIAPQIALRWPPSGHQEALRRWTAWVVISHRHLSLILRSSLYLCSGRAKLTHCR